MTEAARPPSGKPRIHWITASSFAVFCTIIVYVAMLEVFSFQDQPSVEDEPESVTVQAVQSEVQVVQSEVQAVELKVQAEEPPSVVLHSSKDFRGTLSLKTEKIVYCPIQKVACSEWLKVFRWVDGQANWEKPLHVKHGLNVLRDLELEAANSILNSPEWLKFAVVREPLERLLSCFLQKCHAWGFEHEYRTCPYLALWPSLFADKSEYPDGVPKKPTGKTLKTVTKALRSRKWEQNFHDYVLMITQWVKRSPCTQNDHWAPQSCHCSLDRTAPLFTIIPFGSNMSARATEVIAPVASTPDRGTEIKDFIEKRMGSNSERPGKKTGAKRKVGDAFTPELLTAVRQAYAKDYELFDRYW
ncbi:unnamed protein product [Discosporangium mesarthrocarpum]